jgi:hypothetical protein
VQPVTAPNPPGFEAQAEAAIQGALESGLTFEAGELGWVDRNERSILVFTDGGGHGRMELTPRRRGEHAGSNLAYYPDLDAEADFVVTFTTRTPAFIVKSAVQAAIGTKELWP